MMPGGFCSSFSRSERLSVASSSGPVRPRRRPGWLYRHNPTNGCRHRRSSSAESRGRLPIGRSGLLHGDFGLGLLALVVVLLVGVAVLLMLGILVVGFRALG